MLVYKAVDREEESKEGQAFEEYVSNQFLRVKTDWKCSPNKYVVYQNDDKSYGITKVESPGEWANDEKNVEVIGKLGELYEAIFKAEDRVGKETTPVYLSKYTGAPKMKIVLGVPVVMSRHNCDSD